MRRLPVVVAVGAALAVAGCAPSPHNDLRHQGESDPGPTVALSSTATASATSSAAPTSSTTSSASPDPATLARTLTGVLLPPASLAQENLNPRDPAAPAATALEFPCTAATPAGLTGYRESWVSDSGASTLVQQAASGRDTGAEVVEAARRAADCVSVTRPAGVAQVRPITDLAPLAGADAQYGWCERLPSGAGGCVVLVGYRDLVTSVRLDTISDNRAREVLGRVLPQVVARLTHP